MKPKSEPIFHILHRAEWEVARSVGVYAPKGLEQEGFIHFSFRDQVASTAARYYQNDTDLVVLEVDPQRSAAPLKVEMAPHGGFFPHLYGPLELDAVVKVRPLEKDYSGNYMFSG